MTRLVTINGITTVIGPKGEKGPPGEMGLPGVNGRDGRDAPSKEEILDALRNDKELRDSIIDNLEWTFDFERDEMGFMKTLKARGKLKEDK